MKHGEVTRPSVVGTFRYNTLSPFELPRDDVLRMKEYLTVG